MNIVHTETLNKPGYVLLGRLMSAFLVLATIVAAAVVLAIWFCVILGMGAAWAIAEASHYFQKLYVKFNKAAKEYQRIFMRRFE